MNQVYTCELSTCVFPCHVTCAVELTLHITHAPWMGRSFCGVTDIHASCRHALPSVLTAQSQITTAQQVMKRIGKEKRTSHNITFLAWRTAHTVVFQEKWGEAHERTLRLWCQVPG